MYGQLSVTSFTVLAPGTKLRLLSYLYPPSYLAGLCFEFMKPHSVAQAGLKITQSSCFGTSPKPQSAVITGMSHHTQLKVTTLVVVADHLGPSFTLDPAHLLGLFLDPTPFSLSLSLMWGNGQSLKGINFVFSTFHSIKMAGQKCMIKTYLEN